MAKTIGLVDQVKTIETKFGPMQKMQIGNVWYSIKGKNPYEVSVGETVTFDAEQDGQWWNARNVAAVSQAAAQAVKVLAVAPAVPVASSGDAKERSICRQSAIKAAVNTMAQINTANLTDEQMRTEIFRWAFWFYRISHDEKQWDLQARILGEKSDE